MSQLARLGRVKKVGWRSAYTHVDHNSMCALRSSMRFAEITHLQAFHLALASPMSIMGRLRHALHARSF